MYIDANGLRVACEAPEAFVAGEPFDLLVLVTGYTQPPALTVTLAIDDGDAVGIDVRSGEQMDMAGGYVFIVGVPALTEGDVATLAFVARDGVRQVPPLGSPPATMTITAGSAPALRQPEEKDDTSPQTLVDLAEPFEVPSVHGLLDRLSRHGVTTPDDLLFSWARNDLPELGEAEEHLAGRLVGLASLGTLPLTPEGRLRLVDAGIRTPADVAASTRATLEALLSAPDGAGELLAAATAQTDILSVLETGRRVSRANGALPAAANADEAEECGCEDCRAATSPMAYLTDLLGYVTRRMSRAGDPVTVASLTRTLCQPLADLPLDCSTTEEDVADVRLVVESIEELLRRELRADPDVAVAPVNHRITFLVAADIDGDGRDELVLGFDEVLGHTGRSAAIRALGHALRRAGSALEARAARDGLPARHPAAAARYARGLRVRCPFQVRLHTTAG